MNKSWWATLVTILFLAGCGQPQGLRESEQSLLFLRSGLGVALIEPGASEPAFRDGSSLPTRDWSTVIKTRIDHGSTFVGSVDPSTNKENWSQTVPGRLEAKVVSEDGDVVALGPGAELPYSLGRKETRLTIVRHDSATETFTLEGNFEPEAFSTDGRSLFVISYLPARWPTKYQVRRLDLDSGVVRGVYTPHEELQETMGGTARIQQGSPDGKRLYTLYTVGHGDNGYAFIHVLSLDELWAHCIALPEGFASGPERASALSTSPDGKSLYVANSDSELIAEVDTERLTVARSGSVDLGYGFGETHATNASNTSLYVATGNEITLVDLSDLTERDEWFLEEDVSGLQESVDGAHLYVGQRKQISVIDVETGETTDTVDPPGVGRITQLGPEAPRLEEEVPKDLECAC